MSSMFDSTGRLNIPLKADIPIPSEKAGTKEGRIILKEAYCQNGHSLMSEILINDEKGIQLVYTDIQGKREADVVVSPVVGDFTKVILKGKPFEEGEIIKALCPTCREELPVLFDCECGAHVYLFYLDTSLDHNYGQSFCSRIACDKGSRIRFSSDMLRDFINQYRF